MNYPQYPLFSLLSGALHISARNGGWSGQAAVLGNFQCLGVLPIWSMVGQRPACRHAVGAKFGLSGVFYSRSFFYPFGDRISYLLLLPFFLSGDDMILTDTLSQRAVKPKPTNRKHADPHQTAFVVCSGSVCIIMCWYKVKHASPFCN